MPSKVISVSTEPTDGTASLQLQDKSSGVWSVTSKYAIPSTLVNAIGWNRQVVKTSLATVNNVQMTYATFEDSCILKTTPQGSDVVVARITGFPTPSNWDGVSILDQGNVNATAMLVAFTTVDGLKPKTDLFDIQPNATFTVFQCGDFNNDGYTDIVVNLQGSNVWSTHGGPIFYLNNKSGKLIKTSIADLPIAPQNSNAWPDSTSLVRDMNGDGIPDLVYYTTTTVPNLLNNSFRIHWGKKYIGQ